MGVDFVIVNHKSKELFPMGRAYNSHWNNNKEWIYDKHLLLEEVCYLYRLAEAGYCLWLRDQIWNFIQGIDDDSQIEILNDSNDGDILHKMTYGKLDFETKKYISPPEYNVLDGRYCKKEVWDQWIIDNY